MGPTSSLLDDARTGNEAQGCAKHQTLLLDAFEKEVEAWDNEDDEEEPEPCPQEGFHQMLHCIIFHLRSKSLQTHVELNDTVIPLSEVAKLDYPSEEQKPDVSDRQAIILKLITCFYQTVCVISMEQNISPENVYADPNLLMCALHRVHAIH